MYTTLQRLERDGLVESEDAEGERSQKRYRITSVGDREPADWLRTPPDLVPPPRDEPVIKVLVAPQVPGVDVHEILQVHRRHTIEVMQRYTKIKAAAASDGAGARCRRRALPARRDRPLARRRRHPLEATAASHAGRGGRASHQAPTSLMEVSAMTPHSNPPGIEDLRLRASEVHALSQVDLSVERDELVAHGAERLREEHLS